MRALSSSAQRSYAQSPIPVRCRRSGRCGHAQGDGMGKLTTLRAVAVACAGAVLLGEPSGVLAQANSVASGGPTPGEDSPEWRQRMEARVQQLEKENAELRNKV